MILDIIVILKQDDESENNNEIEQHNYNKNNSDLSEIVGNLSCPCLEEKLFENKSNYSFNDASDFKESKLGYGKSKISDLTTNFYDKSSIRNENSNREINSKIQQNSSDRSNKNVKLKREMTFGIKSEKTYSTKMIKDSSIISNISSNSKTNKQSSISCSDIPYENEGDFDIPVSDNNLKSEIKKELKRLSKNKTCNFLSTNQLEEILNQVVNQFKILYKENQKTILELNNLDACPINIQITREFLRNNKSEIENLILINLKEIKEKNKFASKMARKLVLDLNALKIISERNYRTIENKVKQQKETYKQKQNSFVDHIKFCNEM